jgi:predicted membrane channel-forming protein YqfA (hemolysin III family)
MIFSHILSGFILAGAGVGVFWHFFGRISLFNRLLWGFFLLTTSLAALIGVLHFAGNESLEPLHRSMIVLSDTLGVVCVVTAVYALLNQRTLSLITFVSTVLFGLFLFITLLLPDVRVFTPIVPSMGILVLMLLAVFALLQRNKRGLWVVLAAMMMGLATKADSFNSLIHPTDFYHYATTLALWFFGKAAEYRVSVR